MTQTHMKRMARKTGWQTLSWMFGAAKWPSRPSHEFSMSCSEVAPSEPVDFLTNEQLSPLGGLLAIPCFETLISRISVNFVILDFKFVCL
jgi:hypothetical protein